MKQLLKSLSLFFMFLSVHANAIYSQEAGSPSVGTKTTVDSGDRCTDPDGCNCGHTVIVEGCRCHITTSSDGKGNGICDDYRKPGTYKPIWQNPWLIGGVLVGITAVGIAASRKRNRDKTRVSDRV